MDALGDTAIAIDSFRYRSEGQEADIGETYIYIYGLLQVLVVQQDAAASVYRRVFDKEPAKDDGLEHIREIRNSSTGHPTRRKYGKFKDASSFVARSTMSMTFFQLSMSTPGKPAQFLDINLRNFIETQQAVLEEHLQATIEHMKLMENKFRGMFRDKPMSPYLEKMPYISQQLMRAVIEEDRLPLGSAAVKTMEKAFRQYEEAYKARFHREHTLYELAYARRALVRLNEYYSGRLDSEEDAYIYASFVDTILTQLIKAAAEIDAEFSADT